MRKNNNKIYMRKLFYSVKLEKESKENKFYKFIWFRGEKKNSKVLQVVKLKKIG